MRCSNSLGDCIWADGSPVEYLGFRDDKWPLDFDVWGQQFHLGVYLALTDNEENCNIFIFDLYNSVLLI